MGFVCLFDLSGDPQKRWVEMKEMETQEKKDLASDPLGSRVRGRSGGGCFPKGGRELCAQPWLPQC